MKKILVMLLVASMSFSAIACASENDSLTNNESANLINQDSDESSTNTSDDETEIDYTQILCEDANYWLSFNCSSTGIAFCEDNSYINATIGDELGTWEINDTILSITLEDGNSIDYEIKYINDMCLLIGDNTILYNYNHQSELPIKEVEITMDNWKEYLEEGSYTEEREDVFGEVTDVSEYKCLKLKDEYFKYCINEGFSDYSYINFRFRYQDSEETYDEKMSLHLDSNIVRYGDIKGKWWFGYGLSKNGFEMVKIQGTLYFIDIE